MPIKPVSSPRDRRRFVALPHRLHRQVPQWVPPLRMTEKRLFNRRHPNYRHSEAAFFLYEEAGAVTGRVGVQENTVFNEVRGSRWGFFHLFEAADDAAAGALLAAAEDWARGRGLDRLVGPLGFIPGEAMGVLVEGFEHPSSMSIPWHPPGYSKMIEAAGYAKETDFRSGVIEQPFQVPEALFEMGDAAVAEHGYRVKTFDSRRELERWVHHIGEVYNAAFRDNWEYRPISRAEMDEVATQFMPIAIPRLIVLLMHGDDIVGFLFILPEVRQGLKKAGGRLLPIGWWHILRAKRTTTVVAMLGMGVVPGFQGAGANAAIYARVARAAADSPYVAAELVQVEEGNVRMNRNLEAFGVDWRKRHRVYGKAL